MKIDKPKEWFQRSAEIEGEAEVGCGALTPVAGSAQTLEWSEMSLMGYAFWESRPSDNVIYRIVEVDEKIFRTFLTTGDAHKFCRQIVDDSYDFEAVKGACAFHWLNDQAEPPTNL